MKKNDIELDEIDLLVRKAFCNVKAPPCPDFSSIKDEAAETKKGFWSDVWNKLVKTRDEIGNGIRELSDDALDGVCAAGEKKSVETDHFKNDKDLSGK
jgi:hypothetical protein